MNGQESLQTKTEITQKYVLLFWLPLGAMWIMMGIEQPVIAAFVARLPEVKKNLAAFGITFSLALFIESPIIQLLTAGTALSKNSANYSRLLTFTHILSAGLTVLHLIIALTPLYRGIVQGLMGVPEDVVEPGRISFLILSPWTAAIAYRRLWQGILIRYKRTKVIPINMGMRLGASILVLFIGFTFKGLTGANLGAVALTIGVIVGAAGAYGFARPIIKEHLSAPKIDGKSSTEDGISWHELLRFYVPLALTPLLVLGARPLLTIGLARASFPLESLAVWPVLTGVLFIFSSLSLSYQEVVVSLLGNKEDFKILKGFCMKLSIGLGLIYTVFVLSPAAEFWFKRIAGLQDDLLTFVKVPSIILVVVPTLYAVVSWFRGQYVQKMQTMVITKAVAVNIIVLLAVMFAGARIKQLSGVTVAALAFSSSVTAESIFFYFQKRRIKAPV